MTAVLGRQALKRLCGGALVLLGHLAPRQLEQHVAGELGVRFATLGRGLQALRRRGVVAGFQ